MWDFGTIRKIVPSYHCNLFLKVIYYEYRQTKYKKAKHQNLGGI
ncbi:gp50 [Listeria phage P40]|nr:gp50 [Listeria phage P40]ACI00410.1 gp50 [Listeria phage P40]